jgi:hypothetical protein
MFDKLDYLYLDYFSYTCKDNKTFWMEVEGSMLLVGNFIEKSKGLFVSAYNLARLYNLNYII